MQEVQKATMKARWEMFHAATDADGALGQAPALLTTAEGNLRVFTHDVLYPHHDKDVRSLAPYPISLLKNVEVTVWLLDYWGQMRSIVISPSSGTVHVRSYVLVIECTSELSPPHASTERLTLLRDELPHLKPTAGSFGSTRRQLTGISYLPTHFFLAKSARNSPKRKLRKNARATARNASTNLNLFPRPTGKKSRPHLLPAG